MYFKKLYRYFVKNFIWLLFFHFSLFFIITFFFYDNIVNIFFRASICTDEFPTPSEMILRHLLYAWFMYLESLRSNNEEDIKISLQTLNHMWDVIHHQYIAARLVELHEKSFLELKIHLNKIIVSNLGWNNFVPELRFKNEDIDEYKWVINEMIKELLVYYVAASAFNEIQLLEWSRNLDEYIMYQQMAEFTMKKNFHKLIKFQNTLDYILVNRFNPYKLMITYYSDNDKFLALKMFKDSNDAYMMWKHVIYHDVPINVDNYVRVKDFFLTKELDMKSLDKCMSIHDMLDLLKQKPFATDR